LLAFSNHPVIRRQLAGVLSEENGITQEKAGLPGVERSV
jgi:hypothetical protein